ncbi:hypothetical protein HHI36_015678 [Cryptolaemus montrouzieri]|uniref:ZAD domain-containing protein n=1 Tax=Cryptolaemus montrouzieri TaxID=559131 RepID=A0ABD2N6Q8_9CUCU
MRCFVPNCENTIGVPFPEDFELKNIWLESLQVTDGTPDSSSFVCFDHFDKNNVEEIVNEEGSIEKKLLPGAIPRLLSLDYVIEKETEEFLEFKSPKCVTSHDSSELLDPPESNHQEDVIQPTKEDVIQPSEDVTEQAQPDQTVPLNAEQSEFGTQFQEFQEPDFILEQQEYSQSETSPQPFPTYSQNAEDTQNPEQNIGQEANLEIHENQDFLTVQHEFSPNQVFTTEGQVFSTEGQPVQIYTSEGQPVFNAEGQPVFTTEGQAVFVSDGQPLLTQEGHQVFISEEELQNASVEDQKFAIGEEITNKNAISEIKEEHMQEEVEVKHDDSQEMDLESQQINSEQGENHQEEMMAEEDINREASTSAVATEEFEEPQPDLPQDEFYSNQESMEINQEEKPQVYSEVLQQSTDDHEMQEEKEAEPFVTPPENIVMQWFVPNQPNMKTDSNVQDAETGGASQDDNRIVISYRPELEVPQQTVMQSQIVVNKNQEIPTPVKMVRQDNVSALEKSKDDSCRLCMSNEQVTVNILDNLKDTIMVLEAIQLCIHPLEVSLEDPFSKKICTRCFNVLQTYFEFRLNCIKVDVEQKRNYEKFHPLSRFMEKRKSVHQIGSYPKKTHMKTIISPSGMGYRQTEIVTVMGSNSKMPGSTKNITKKVILTPTPKRSRQADEIQYLLKDVNSDVGPNEKCVRQIINKVSRADDIQVFKLKKSPTSTTNGQSYPARYSSMQKTTVPLSLSPKKLNQSQIEALARKPPLSRAKQMKIQEELKKVIEGTMSKDDLSVDQVIVRVVSDDETEDATEHFPSKRKKYNYAGSGMIEPKQEFSKMKIGRSEVLIPKGIRVTIPDRFESSKGIFPCFPKIGAFGTEFALIDGYLFEHRLCKGKERFLKCVSCSAVASQKLLSTGKFENRACVKTAHNHHQLTSTEIKKQMFYYVMKKKMQADKGLNFRSVYDQICEKDPEIKYLVPLRHLINEICKHQLTQKMPSIKSFDDFYNLIEDDSLQKFQFTYSGNQFYQERFTVKDEGTKAVIFANVETIKKVSQSKLMYVDASFRIDTGENFSYQLVTVLVWMDDSYYPIMFALVSDRTMEIFKKIFSYLHDTLAPDLCPEEIVTDYEANIYYALGETYLESHIGGSVFYYTQNLYKKICELGLSRSWKPRPTLETYTTCC